MARNKKVNSSAAPTMEKPVEAQEPSLKAGHISAGGPESISTSGPMKLTEHPDLYKEPAKPVEWKPLDVANKLTEELSDTPKELQGPVVPQYSDLTLPFEKEEVTQELLARESELLELQRTMGEQAASQDRIDALVAGLKEDALQREVTATKNKKGIASVAERTEKVLFVNIFQIDVDPTYNPRNMNDRWNKAHVASICGTVLETGLKEIPPLLCYVKNSRYVVVDGHSRRSAILDAIQIYGKENVHQVPVILEEKGTTPLERLYAPLIRNKGKTLAPSERAAQVKKILEAGDTPSTIAKKMGVTPARISQFLNLLAQPEVVQVAVAEGKITESQLRTSLSSKNVAPENLEKVVSLAAEIAQEAGKSKVENVDIQEALQAIQPPEETPSGKKPFIQLSPETVQKISDQIRAKKDALYALQQEQEPEGEQGDSNEIPEGYEEVEEEDNDPFSNMPAAPEASQTPAKGPVKGGRDQAATQQPSAVTAAPTTLPSGNTPSISSGLGSMPVITPSQKLEYVKTLLVGAFVSFLAAGERCEIAMATEDWYNICETLDLPEPDPHGLLSTKTSKKTGNK